MGRPVIMIPTGVHKNNRLQLERTFNLSKGAIIMTTIRRQNLKRCDGNKPNIQDVPRAKRRNLGLSIIRTAPQLAKGPHFWSTESSSGGEGGDDVRYVSMDNNGRLRTAIGEPNPDFGPTLFGLEPGRQAGEYRIYTYAMVPSNNRLYALTVVKDANGHYNLKYSNEDGYNYDWHFSYCDADGNFAIRWCDSNSSDKNTCFVLYLDNDTLNLVSYPSNKALLPQHFISNFYSVR